MSLPKEVLIHAIKTTGSPEKAAALYSEYEQIRQKAISRVLKVQGIRSKADEDIAKILADKICRHDVRKTVGDPSGNGGSYEECLICGENIYERAVRFT